MTAMNKSSDSHSYSEEFDSPQPPPSNSHTKFSYSKPKSPNNQPNNKSSKLLSLKNKHLMLRSSPTKPLPSSITQSYPISNTPPVHENCSPPPPNNKVQITPHYNLSPCHSQSPPLSSPPYFHNSPLPDDTSCGNSSNDSPKHNV